MNRIYKCGGIVMQASSMRCGCEFSVYGLISIVFPKEVRNEKSVTTSLLRAGLAAAGLLTLAAAPTNQAGLAKIGDRPALPWSAPADKTTVSELTFASGSARLTGTLHLLVTTRPSPVVVVYHGASDASRGAPLYRHLIEMLPPLGIGVFVYDRRGSGQSTGPSADGSFELLADDGIAGRNMLAKNPRIDAKRIGYWGLSQGGWLAALAARRDPHCAFAISISAPMTTADVQMRFAAANILRIHGYDQRAIDIAVDARLAVDEFMVGKVDRANAQRRLDAASTQPWFDLIYMDRTFGDPGKSRWAREMRNDPLSVMTKVKAPILVLYGSADPWVPVATSLERLEPLKVRQPNISLHVVANADHAMMTSASPLAQVDPKAMAKQAPEAPEYFAVLVRWLIAHGLTNGRSAQ